MVFDYISVNFIRIFKMDLNNINYLIIQLTLYPINLVYTLYLASIFQLIFSMRSENHLFKNLSHYKAA